MRMACDHPGSIEKLIVVDIAPRDYPSEHHIPTLEALMELDLGKMSSRKEADLALSEKFPTGHLDNFFLPI